MSDLTNQKTVAFRISIISIIVNIILSIIKLAAGIIARSGAMISDAVHSISDVFSTFIVMIGINMASKPSDDDHQYGHERMECVAAIILAVILCITGLGIGYDGIQKVMAGLNGNLAAPGSLALYAAILSIFAKEAMYWYTRAGAKKINSGALMADAWHHRTDALSSVGSFIGIFGARLGYPILDPIASVLICVLIVKASYDIFKDAIQKMADTSCDNKTQEAMIDCIMGHEDVLGLDMLKTRLFGSRIYVDIEISVNSDLSIKEANQISQEVHDCVEENFPMVKHCMIHINPYTED